MGEGGVRIEVCVCVCGVRFGGGGAADFVVQTIEVTVRLAPSHRGAPGS